MDLVLVGKDAPLVPTRRQPAGHQITAPDRPGAALLIGRGRERARLRALLIDRTPGVVTITGPGGVGKSALVDAVCRELSAVHSLAVQTVDVARPGAGTLLERLGGQGLSGSVGLVIADRADDDPAAVRDLAGSLPGSCTVVACAIRPLGVPGERVLGVGPLPVVDPDDDPERLATNPGVRLFLARAPMPAGVVHHPDAQLPAIATVCRAVGGWPLAIELAAGRAGLLPADALARLLVDAPDLAFEPVPDPADPTRLLPSLRAAFARTWRHLLGPEHAMLRAATVFAGPFTVQQVAAVAGIAVPAAVGVLAELVELHLIDRSPEPPGDRFFARPPVRQYARWTFGRAAPERPLRLRYTALIRQQAHASASANLRGDEQTSMDTIRDVAAELIPVLDQLTESGAIDQALQLSGDLAPGLVQSGQFEGVADRVDALLRRPDLSAGPALADALLAYADMVFTGIDGADRQDLAAERLWRGVALAREHGDLLARLRSLAVVVGAWPVLRDVEVGARCVTEGLDLARRAGSAPWLARFEAWAGMLAHQTGDLAAAAELGVATLARGRRCGDDRARLLAGILLHTIPEPPAEVPGGLPRLVDLLPLAHRLVEPRLESIVLAYLAHARLSAGQLAESAYWSARALEVGGSLDTWFGAGFAIMFLTAVARVRGDPEQAATLHGMVADRLDELTANLPPRIGADHRTVIAELAASSDPAAFNEHLRAGSMLSWRDATAAALSYAYRVGDPAAVENRDGDREPSRSKTAPGRPGATEAPVPLTPRERQVLALVAEGRDTRTIAGQLRISVNAASHHISSILAKLGVENRTQAAIWAVQHPFA